MKYFLITIMLLVASAGLHASDDQAKSYEEMTLEELQAVNTKALDKSAKKAHKKALRDAKKAAKAAQKAERKRQKAAQRAERARQKAEKKRLAKLAKMKRKTQKRAQKKLNYINKVYNGTSIIKDDFEANIQIRGRDGSQYDSDIIYVLGNGGRIRYFLRSFYNPQSNNIVLQAYVTIKFSEVVNEAMLAEHHLTAAAYATQQGWWKKYSLAALRGGIGLEVKRIRSYTDNCAYYCAFYEDIAITLDLEAVQKAVYQQQDLAMKISSKYAPPLVLNIPHDYMVGYLLRLSETDSRLSHVSVDARTNINAIRAQTTD